MTLLQSLCVAAIDGCWTPWSPWTVCSVSCGLDGTTLRDRTCTNPVPAFGGAPCDGNTKEVIGCCKGPCREWCRPYFFSLVPLPAGGGRWRLALAYNGCGNA